MSNQPTHKSILEQVSSAIKEGQVQMRPRWYFVLRGVLAVTGGALIGLTLLFLISLIIFTLRQNGVGFAPAFGPRGWFIFLRSLPWLLITLSLVFIVLLELFARRYPFAYRRPLLYSACGIIILVVGGGFIVASTSLHRTVARYAMEHHVPVGEGFYRGIRQREVANIYPGVVLATTTDGVLLSSRRGDTLTIIIGPSTRRRGFHLLEPEQTIVVFGEPTTSGTVRAFGLHLIDAE